MNLANYTDQSLCVESVPLKAVAEKFGTPAYVYSWAAIQHQYVQLESALEKQPHQICYAVKANSNLGVLSILAQLGAGFDVVSSGELERVIQAGGQAEKIVFSGVGKSTEEINFALKLGIQCINVESQAELLRIERQAELLDRVAPVSIRINPDIDAKTHPYISTGLTENKFGVTLDLALELFKYAHVSDHLQVKGVDCHIGSQITELAPLMDTAKAMLKMVDELAECDINISHIDMGGGVGVEYCGEDIFSIQEYAQGLVHLLKDRNLTLLVEPGRYLLANAGLLLTRVEYLKPGQAASRGRNFAIVDAAMNDLIRPALYQAQHSVKAVSQEKAVSQCTDVSELKSWDLVGPVCESADFLAKDCELAIQQGDLLAIMSAGAYGFVQSSNYNSRNRAPEIIISGDQMHLTRRRETINDQLALESTFPHPASNP